MYDFFLYSGSVVNGQTCTGSYVVLKLLETLPKYKNFKIFFDNLFSSIPLCLALKDYGYLAAAALRADCTKDCPLPAEKYLKKQGRGSHSFRTNANSGISLTKWFDTKCVQIITNYCNPDSVGKVRWWDCQKRQFIEIDCPTVVEQYNKSMGGVDLSDILISLYRTPRKTKGWYLKVLFHCVDIVKVNAWLIYCRDCNQLKVSKKSQLSLVKFTMMIAAALTKSHNIQRAVGRPSKRKLDGDLPLER